MHSLLLGLSEAASPSVLCLGAHCDDIEIGCGGTIRQIAKAAPQTRFDWVVFCSDETRKKETEAAARMLTDGAADVHLHFLNFRDGYLPFSGSEAKDELRALSITMKPTVVFSHYRRDAHQDHRLISEITYHLFRNHLILEYEIPKYDGDLGQPNVFVPLNDARANEKIRVLLECFRSQANKHWFTDETFRSILR